MNKLEDISIFQIDMYTIQEKNKLKSMILKET